jgi:hypothetical protein
MSVPASNILFDMLVRTVRGEELNLSTCISPSEEYSNLASMLLDD